MPDYKEALRHGLDAKEKLDRAKADMSELLHEVADSLSEMLGKGVQFRLTTSVRMVEGVQTKIGEIMGILPKKSREEIWVLQVSKDGVGNTALAEVEFAETGYPVSVVWPGQYASVNARQELSDAIASLLASRHAGEKLHPYLEPPQPQ